MTLEQYRQRRDFSATPEPKPRRRSKNGAPLRFVVQKHRARRLHYDVRFELDGVLKSWAVPRGPSLNPADKRLAVMVEDHPIDYGVFEGVIPAGEYGAGEVIVWDEGTYAPEDENDQPIDQRAAAEQRMREGLASGRVSIILRGHRLRGGWALVKTRRKADEWLLVKRRDAFASADADALAAESSVVSGQTIADLSGKSDAPAQESERGRRRAERSTHAQRARLSRGASGVADKASLERGSGTDRTTRRTRGGPVRAELLPGAVQAPFPKSIAPMLPTLTPEPFSHPDWIFEPKLDGVRAIGFMAEGSVRLVSRRGLDVARQYPEIAADLARRGLREAALDGEIVALDEHGRPSFHRLQQRMNLTSEREIRRAEATIPLVYYVFDLLYLDGFDLRATPIEDRKQTLAALLQPSERVRTLDSFPEIGEIAYRAALDHGFEGIVAKKRGSTYQTGKRSRLWLKVKGTRTDDFVVGGYSQGLGSRADTLGALLVGSVDDEGRLRYAGHVGTGLDERLLRSLRARLDALRTDECPFAERPPIKSKTTWVRPETVVEVKFAEWTPDGRLRAPVLVRVRDDKAPTEAQRSEVVPAPESVSPVRPDHQPGAIDEVLQQLERDRDAMTLHVEDDDVPVSNLDKVLWPESSGRPVTKRELLRYYARVARHLLPHLRDRPLTTIRLPEGIDGPRFFQKHAGHAPSFVESVRLYSKHAGGSQKYILCNNLATLIWLGQIASMELHPSYARVRPEPDAGNLGEGSAAPSADTLFDYPDFLVFDLDPYIYSGLEPPGAEPELNPSGFSRTCEVALWLKETLDALKLPSFVKTSGRTGLHIFVPVLRQLPYGAIHAAAEMTARYLERMHPDAITTAWAVAKRTGKVFVDFNQNARAKTVSAIFSPRAAPGASVSTPLDWSELGRIYPTDFTIATTPERLRARGDPWEGILDAKVDLGATLAVA
ncbi:MAG TPA: DNA ligase D [Chloroflexota bacterium]|nr:DNA ligase D [Chloroflexota bacterium]